METWGAISWIVAVSIIICAGILSARVARRTVAVAPVAVIWAMVIPVAAVIIAVIVTIAPVVVPVVAISTGSVVGVVGTPTVSLVVLSQHLLAIIIEIDAALVVAAIPVTAVTFINSELGAVKRAGAADDVCGSVLDS